MPRLELFSFRFRDPLTGKWVRARYRASLTDLEQRYGEGRYRVTGPPEIREVDTEARYFDPAREERRADSGSIGNVGQILIVGRPLERQPRTIAGTAIQLAPLRPSVTDTAPPSASTLAPED
jgi:hypothetical protein